MKYKAPYFARADKEEMKRIAIKGGHANRSPEANRAWEIKDQIKREYETTDETYRSLAKKYKVSRTTIDRIVNS